MAVKDNVKTINLKYRDQIKILIIDEEDFDKIKNMKLRIMKGRNTFYVALNNKILIHRFLTNCPKGLCVDHINNNGLDNRKSNLQICTVKENTRKRRKTNGKFKYKGISFREGLTKPYRTKISIDDKTVHIGYFRTLEEAAVAYNEAVLKHFGKFSILNEV